MSGRPSLLRSCSKSSPIRARARDFLSGEKHVLVPVASAALVDSRAFVATMADTIVMRVSMLVSLACVACVAVAAVRSTGSILQRILNVPDSCLVSNTRALYFFGQRHTELPGVQSHCGLSAGL